MERKPIAGLMVLAAFLGAFGGMNVSNDDAPYYCESRDTICIGQRLSDTGKTCYYLADGTEKRAVCREGWTVFSMDTDKLELEAYIYANNCLHTCKYHNSLESYTMCTCDNGQYAYAGELI